MVNITIKPEHIIINPMDPEVISKIQAKNFMEKSIHKCNSPYQKINVVENFLGRFLVFDNFPQAGIIKNELYSGNLPYINYFFLSCLLNPNIKNVLMLGMGTGNFAVSLSELLPDLESFDLVDLDYKVYSIAKKYFDFKENSKIKVHIQDAVEFVKNSKTKYDLIILDIGNSKGIPLSFLTEEFISETSSLLNENGIMISNVFSSHEFNSDKNVIFKSTLKTYKNVFNEIRLFPVIYGDYVINKVFYGLEGVVQDSISVLLFSSKDKIIISKEELINRAKELQQKSSLQDIEKLDKFAEDLLTEEINTDNFKPFREAYKNDPEFNNDTIKDYLFLS